ncbi:hypothetical protein KM043_002492 [Ampulex compressa]|nr:hypothetical protein KM043_002492 [Ampulex compressa]
METSFPKISTDVLATTNPTKVNIFVPSIPEHSRYVADLVLLCVGILLNVLLLVFTVFNPSTHKSTACYVASLAFSNFVILLEPLQQVLRWSSQLDLQLNLDYVCLTSFDITMLTTALLNIQMYVTLCQPNWSLTRSMVKLYSGVKAVATIWTFSVVATAVDLHLYDFFDEVMYDIYVFSTFMFLILPTAIFVILDLLILYELLILKWAEGSWRDKELNDFLTLGEPWNLILTLTTCRLYNRLFY